MIKNFLNKLFKKTDRFLVIEILSHFLRVSYIQADLNRRRIYLAKTFSSENSLDNPNETFLQLKKLLKKFEKLSNYQIILNLDSSLAATIYSTVSLIRNHQKEFIDEADLDNLISQAISKVLDRYRAKAAAKLKVADLDIILSDVKVKRIKIDGHKVVNPLGFPAKLVEIGIVQTFTNRNFIINLKSLLPKEKVVLISEAGASWASVLENSAEPKFLLINLFPRKSSIYFSSPNSFFYLDTFNWGEKNLVIALANNLIVNTDTAKKILNRYILSNCSDFFSRKIGKFLSEEFKVLIGEVEDRAKKNKVQTVYFLPFFALPSIAHFRSRLKILILSQVEGNEATDDLFGNKFGFEIKLNEQIKKKSIFPILAGWFQFYFLRGDDKIEKAAKRRIKWLN
jgi:hypothetical protein